MNMMLIAFSNIKGYWTNNAIKPIKGVLIKPNQIPMAGRYWRSGITTPDIFNARFLTELFILSE